MEETSLKAPSAQVVVPELSGLPRIAVDGAGEGAELLISGVIGTGGMGRIELGRPRGGR